MSEELSTNDHQASGNRVLRVILGLGLVLPAAICCLSSMVIPTLSTFNMSLRESNGFGPGQFIGFENYTRLLGDRIFIQALGFTLQIIVARLLIVAVLPLLLALGVNAFGRAVRIPVRLAFTVPLALYAPAALALSWGLVLNPSIGLVQEPLLADPDTAGWAFMLTNGLFVLGLATGLGLIVYLAALRGPGEAPPTFNQVRRPLIIAWVISLLAAVASALQAFDWSWLLTRGGPMNRTMTLAMDQYNVGFVRFNFGMGSAMAVPALVITLLLGLIAGLAVVLGRLRLEHVSAAKSSFSGSKAVFGLILALALLVGIAGCLVNAAAIPAGLSTASKMLARGPDLAESASIVRSLLLNTVMIQVLFVLLLQMPVTYLAALGIGGLRPLGRRSEWLLLLFSPWLFVTAGQLLLALFEQMRSAQMVDTYLAIAGPFGVSVPILFVLTLFFKGREKPFQEAVAGGKSSPSAFFSTIVAPSLPLALLLALAAILVGIQRLQWPLVVTTSQELFTMPLTLTLLAGQYASDAAVIGQAISVFVLPIFVFFLIAFCIFQVFYLERLALCGPSDQPEAQQPPVAETSTSQMEP